MNKAVSMTLVVILVLTAVVFPQSGGTYQMEKSVVSSSGGEASGGTYSGTFTIGQPFAGGSLNGGTNQAYTGFWTPPPLGPTAAGVTVSGRVINERGRGLNRAAVTITDLNGSARHVMTNAFGFYRFEDVAAGASYVVSVRARRYTFEQPSAFINVSDNVGDVNFVGSAGR